MEQSTVEMIFYVWVGFMVVAALSLPFIIRFIIKRLK